MAQDFECTTQIWNLADTDRQSLARAPSALLCVAPVPLFPIRNDDEKQPLSSLSLFPFVNVSVRKVQVTSAKSAPKVDQGREF